MSKTKQKPSITARPVLDPALAEAAASFALSAADRRFITRVAKLQIQIVQPRYLRRAEAEGYTEAEHTKGVLLRRTAAGEDRPLAALFEAVRSAPDGTNAAVLQAIDAIENKWFPRTAAIIRRVVSEVTGSAEKGDEFAAAFFDDLAQQPLGPTVVASVRTFLTRVEALAKSDEPGARQVLATLASRGLDAAERARIDALVASAEVPTRGSPALATPALETARIAQMQALAALERWYADWATTFRGVFSAREQVALGLAAPAPSRGASEQEPADDVDTDVDADSDADDDGRGEA